MGFRAEKFEIWKQAKAFAEKIHNLSLDFPQYERAGLVDQLQHASALIPQYINNCSERKTDKEIKYILKQALDSIEPVVTALDMSLEQQYINQAEYDECYSEANMLASRISDQIERLKE